MEVPQVLTPEHPTNIPWCNLKSKTTFQPLKIENFPGDKSTYKSHYINTTSKTHSATLGVSSTHKLTHSPIF